MTPLEFIVKWRVSELKERSAAQEHFIDLCRLLGEPTPAEADPTGAHYCFERGARKDGGGDGWADVWKRHCFAWEYKGKHADLDAAFNQLRQYALALENPPLLIVSDMVRFRIRTNWTNSVSLTHEFGLDDLTDATNRDRLKWAMSDPERLRPGESRQGLTERAAATFAELAQSLRERSHDPQAVAHFVNRLVFCMFAEDVGLLPDNMFTRMLDQARKRPEEFEASGARSVRGDGHRRSDRVRDGGLVQRRIVRRRQCLAAGQSPKIEATLKAAALDWSEIDPSILGTLFERGLDPDKRSQLGAHYTDRDKIMRIIDPVVVRPWLAEWETAKTEIASSLGRAEEREVQGSEDAAPRSGGAPATEPPRRPPRLHRARPRLRLGQLPVPRAPCAQGPGAPNSVGSRGDGAFRARSPRSVRATSAGIEINAYAAELARVIGVDRRDPGGCGATDSTSRATRS